MIRRLTSKKKSEPMRDWRMTILTVVIFLLAIATIYRLFILQVWQGNFYVALASDQHEIYKKLFPQRGTIYLQDTRSGEANQLFPYATNKELNLVYAVPKKIIDVDKTVEQLQELFVWNEAEINDLKNRLLKPDDPYEPIKHFVSEEDIKNLEELNLQGIGYVPETVRYYPEGNIGSHVLGFYGFRGHSQERVGQYGLEGYFSEQLKGEAGSLKTEGDIAGRLITFGTREIKEAHDGSNIVLTLDHTLQFVVCERLKAAVLKHGADAGSVIVMEPKTGAILAMCSYPDYDPNNYQQVEDISVYNNPAIFHFYEPGSIFKPITMAAALDLNLVTPEMTYEDRGEERIAGYVIKNSDFETHGQQTMTQVLEKSLNTGAIFVARKLGIDNFYQYVKNFGFGELTGIELQTEVAGDIDRLKEQKEIYLATASFGQGIAVTPLQLVAAYAAIANQGVLMKPYLVDRIIEPSGNIIKTEPGVVKKVVSEKAATLLAGMLVSVVKNGHGQRAGVPGYLVAGKTGTAQVPKKDSSGYEEGVTIGSFAGFAPAEEPKFTMLVKIDHPRDVQWAESSAAPLFGELAKFILNYYKIPPEVAGD